jgi:hypothetical protein
MRMLLFALFALSAVGLQAAEQLTIRGTFIPTKIENNDLAEKAFTLHIVSAGGETAWTLTESGRGAWPWTERFGKTEQPALLFDRGDGHSIVPLPNLRVEKAELAIGSSWEQDRLTYRVAAEGNVAKTPAWQIIASNDYGPKRTLWIAKDSGHVLRLDEKVFVGQGRECRLHWELTEREALDDAAAKKQLAAFGELAALRDKLAAPKQAREIKWSDGQRQQLAEALPAIVKHAGDGPLAAIAEAAQKDVDTQASRTDALAALREQAIGKPLPKIRLSGASGESWTSDDALDAVTVLHFWDYRDAPLEEPYGQTGYLDFLARQRKRVKVYGVMVDERLAEGQSRGAAAASARKLKSFMNLSYPILLDDGALLKKLGDPRTTGAKLPLWVVIGKDGKVADYHVGFYEVKRDEGLAELEAAISKAK